MTKIIIGGSGMLLEMTKSIIRNSGEKIYLCSRNKDQYGDLLQELHAKFISFDFTNQEDYEGLQATINSERITELIAWIHSPYYEYFETLIMNPIFDNARIYLVKGTSSNDYQFQKDINVIHLGKHPIEDRWLTHSEISDIVINALI